MIIMELIPWEQWLEVKEQMKSVLLHKQNGLDAEIWKEVGELLLLIQNVSIGF